MYGYDFTIETIKELKTINNEIYVKCGTALPFVSLLQPAGMTFKINPLQDKVILYLPVHSGCDFPMNRAFAVLQESKEELILKTSSECFIKINNDGIDIQSDSLPVTINGSSVLLGDGTSEIITKANISSLVITAPSGGGICVIDSSSIVNKVKS